MMAQGMNESDMDRLHAEFDAICRCGGRLSGTESERRAVALLKALGRAATGVDARVETVTYGGWRATASELTGPDGANHPLNPLVRSAATPPGGVEAEVLDLGRGTPEEFDAHRTEIPGRIVLVRHELMFAPGTIHRRIKYRAAVEAGAVGFLIAGPEPGHLVAGSSGRRDEPGIPAAGVAPETARAFRRTVRGRPRARLRISTREAPASVENVFFDLPGPSPGYVVLSAHIDGHDLGESAIDNATGLAVALAVVRRLVPHARTWRRGLRLAFFNVEEWALTGSAAHVAALDDAQRAAIALCINLDSVAGGERLAALTSGFAGLERFLLGCAEETGTGVELDLFLPLQMNSDHGSYARAGIPAFRLVAGFGDPSASVRHVLTPLDRRELVAPHELDRAARLSAAITRAALEADSGEVLGWRVCATPDAPAR